MKALYKRSLTGIFYVLFIITFLIVGPLTFYILFLGFLILGSLEFYNAFAEDSSIKRKIANIILSSSFFTLCFLDASQILEINFAAIVTVVLLTVLVSKLFIKNPDIIKQGGNQFFLFFYIALPLCLSNYIVFSQTLDYKYDFNILLYIFVLIWCNDTGAYLVGSAIGKHKFFERISPKKTWEGVIGGFALSILAAYIISRFNFRLQPLHWMAIGSLVGIFGTLGDLVESMLKRNAKIKDSGNIFPGHGGLLDRIDSLLIALLAIFVYLSFTHNL